LAAEQRLAFLHSPEVLRGGALLLQGALRDAVVMLRAGLQTPLGRGLSRPFGLVYLARISHTGLFLDSNGAVRG